MIARDSQKIVESRVWIIVVRFILNNNAFGLLYKGTIGGTIFLNIPKLRNVDEGLVSLH